MKRVYKERARLISEGAITESEWIHPAVAFENRSDPSQILWVRLGVDELPDPKLFEIRAGSKRPGLLSHQEWDSLLAKGLLPVDLVYYVTHDSSHVLDLVGDLAKMRALRAAAQHVEQAPPSFCEACRILDGQIQPNFPLRPAERFYLRSWFFQEALVLPRLDQASWVKGQFSEQFRIQLGDGFEQGLKNLSAPELHKIAKWWMKNEGRIFRFSGAVHWDRFNFWTLANDGSGYDNLLAAHPSMDELWKTDGLGRLKVENLRGLADAAEANLRKAMSLKYPEAARFPLERGRDHLNRLIRGWVLGVEQRLTAARVIEDSMEMDPAKGNLTRSWIDSFAPPGGLLREAYALPQ